MKNYKKPSVKLFGDNNIDSHNVSRKELLEIKERIVSELEIFGIKPSRVFATIGRVYYQYEIFLSTAWYLKKVKSNLANLYESFALKNACFTIDRHNKSILIEVPSSKPSAFPFIKVLKLSKNSEDELNLPIPLGANVNQKLFISDLTKIPHLLIEAGDKKHLMDAIDSIVASLICWKTPSYVRFGFIDSHQDDFRKYDTLEHTFLLSIDGMKGITNSIDDGIVFLNGLTAELDLRYSLLKESRVRNICEYNRKNDKNGDETNLLYLLIFLKDIKEFSDKQGHSFESLIARLAVLGRAVGIHLIIGTHQKKDHKFGHLIDVNFPARLFFRKDSIKHNEAMEIGRSKEKLLGFGDALVLNSSILVNKNKLQDDNIRLQYPTITKKDFSRLLSFIKNQNFHSSPYSVHSNSELTIIVDDKMLDHLFLKALRLIADRGTLMESDFRESLKIEKSRMNRIIAQLIELNIVEELSYKKERSIRHLPVE